MNSGPPRPNNGNTPKPSGGDTCDFSFPTDLVGIHPVVLEDVEVGDNLVVTIGTENQHAAVICIRSDGLTVGSIGAVSMLSNLIRCIEQEVKYVARVLETGKGRCHVLIVRANQ